MLTNNAPVSFIATKDAVASQAFYEGCLGLKLVEDEYFALVFDLNGHTLRVAKVNKLLPADHAVFGWTTKNIDETVKDLRSRGVIFDVYDGMQQDKLGIWTSPSGAKVAWFKDPDDNILSVTQI